ncbi:MAG: hypothetical protein IT513_03855 [Burkholderiales bacterium]|nr:hypothetical protein [Burkholderiales bacterium]
MNRAGLLAAAALLAVGCMEVEQTVPTDKQVGQTVRRDTAAWSNAPLAAGPSWKQGDRASWEEQIRKRQLAQHEDRRIYR